MSKEHNFTASDVLTPELMNKLTQDSQIVSDSASDKSVSDGHIATTKWVRTANGDTDLNAASANKLKTARKIKIVDASGRYVGGEVNFDGTGNITLTLPDIPSVDTLRRVTFAWLTNSDYIAATAEVICQNSYITWDYEDIELSKISYTGVDAKEITNTQLNSFLKKLGYGGRGTYALGPKHKRILPMNGLSKFPSYNATLNPSDIIIGVYPDRENGDKLYYLTALNYSTSGLNGAAVYATVRRIV